MMARFAIILAAAFGLLLLFSHEASAATCTALTGTRSWGTAADWSCAQVPTASDSVVIPSSATMVVNTNTAAVTSLTVQNGGTLTVGNDGTARTVTINGNLQLDAGGTLTVNNPGSVTNHSLLIGGSFIHNGGLTASNGNGRVNSTFHGPGYGYVYSGVGTGNFFSLTIDKSSGDIRLDRNTTVTQNLTITQGSLQIGNNSQTARTLTVNGHVTIDATGTLGIDYYCNFCSVTHSLYIGGNFIHNGFFDAANTWTSSSPPYNTIGYTYLYTQFSGATSPVSYSGNGTGNFWRLEIFKPSSSYIVTLARDAVVDDGLWVSYGQLVIGDSTTPRTLSVGASVNIYNSVGTLLPNSPASPTTHNLLVACGFSNNGAFYAMNGNGRINTTFNGSSSGCTIGGPNAIDFYGLTINKSSASSTVALARNVTVDSDLTISTGTFDVISYTANRSASGGALTVNAGATIKIGGTNNFPANYTTRTLNGTADYYAASAQTISPQTYTNLTFSGSGVKTLGGATTVNGVLSMQGTSTYATDGHVLTYGGSAILEYKGSAAQTTGPELLATLPNLRIDNANGVTLNSATTVNGTLYLTNGVLSNGVNLILANGAAISRASGSLAAVPTFGTSVNVIYTGSTAVTTGPELPTSASVLNNLTISNSGGVTLNANATVNGSLSLTSGALAIGANTLTLNGAVTCGGGSISSAASGTVSYHQGADGQSVCAGSYWNLTFSDFNKILQGSGWISVANVFTPGSATGHIITASTVNFNGTAAQTIPAFSYNNLLVSNNSAAVTASANFNIAGSLVMNGGNTVLVPAADVIINSGAPAGSITGNGTIRVTRMLATADYANQYRFTSNNLTNLTVDYAGAGDQIINVPSSYGGLRTSGSGVKMLAGTLTVNSAGVTIGAGTTLASNNFNITLGGTGNWTNNGGAFTPGTGSVIFNSSSSNQFIQGSVTSQTFHNLTVSTTSGRFLGPSGGTTTWNVDGTFTINSGGMLFAPVNLNVKGNWANSGTFNASSRTVTFSGTATQNITGSATTSFWNLAISNTSAAVSPSVNFNVAGTMTVNSGATFSPGALVVINNAAPAGTITGVGTIQVSRVAATADYASQYWFNTNNLGGLTVDYAGAGDQTINVPSAYRGLRTSGSDVKTLAGSLTVGLNGVTIGAGTTLASGNFNIALVGTGNWVNNGGAFASGTGTVSFNGSGAQAIGGTTNTAFSNLTINNTSADSAGVSLGIDQTVNGTLTLTDGLLKVGGYNLTLGANASISGGTSAASMVVTDTDGSAAGDGFLCKNFSDNGSFAFPVGDAWGATEYSPATLDFTADLEPSTVCIRVTNVRHPNWPGAEYPTYLNRYWTATSTDSDFTCTASFVYTDADITLGENQGEDALYHKVWDGSAWMTKNPTDVGSNTLASDVTSFSDHTAFSGSPLAVTLAEFSAVQQGDMVLVTWETASELDNRGFNLYRGVDPAGPERQLNETLIPAQSQGSPIGFVYTWEDRADLVPGATYFYWLEDLDIHGVTTMHGPVSVTLAPQAVTLAGFSAAQQGDSVLVAWETASELDNLGFNLYRGVDPAGPDRQLNTALIPSQSPGSSGGYAYTWEDRADLAPGATYFYWLEDVDMHGTATRHGPVSADFIVPTAVTLAGLRAEGAEAPLLWLAPLATMACFAGLLTVRKKNRRSLNGRQY